MRVKVHRINLDELRLEADRLAILGDAIDDAADGEACWIERDGRRIAMIVPAEDGEALEAAAEIHRALGPPRD